MKVEVTLPKGLDGKVWLYSNAKQNHLIHRHDQLEVNLCASGTASYLVDGRRYPLHRGTQIWLFPEQNHLLLDKSAGFSMWISIFKSKLLRRICADGAPNTLRARKAPAGFCRPLAEHQTARLHQFHEELVGTCGDPARFNSGIAYALLAAWAAQTSSDRLTPSFDIHPAVDRAARLMHEGNDEWSLVELARHAGLSPSRLSLLFRAQTGVSLLEYRNQQRLDRFLRLYRQGRRWSMLAAALTAGFGSYPQFHRVFKRLMGSGPAEYRNKVSKLGSA